jgi:hypothetical protein
MESSNNKSAASIIGKVDAVMKMKCTPLLVFPAVEIEFLGRIVSYP